MHATSPNPSPVPQPTSKKRVVQFYEDEVFMEQTVDQHIHDDLQRGDAVIFISRAARCAGLVAHLEQLGRSVKEAGPTRCLHVFDVETPLAAMMKDGQPDRHTFQAMLTLLEQATAQSSYVRVYEEMKGLFNQDSAVLAFDKLWHDLAERHAFSLVCSYLIGPPRTGEDCSPASLRPGDSPGQALPMQRLADVQGDTRPAPEGRVLEDARILFVDDCEDNRDLIRFILASRGALVDTAENGEKAVKQATQRDYDLILMDIQMPVLDGYQATERLREMGFTKPIIALTAHAMRSDQQKCLDAGCDEHLAKPIETQCLIATVSRYVNKHRFSHTH